jgi:hypothetical protein
VYIAHQEHPAPTAKLVVADATCNTVPRLLHRGGRQRLADHALQLRDLVGRLATAGQHHDGDPDILVVLDAGYDVHRLAYRCSNAEGGEPGGRPSADVIAPEDVDDIAPGALLGGGKPVAHAVPVVATPARAARPT